MAVTTRDGVGQVRLFFYHRGFAFAPVNAGIRHGDSYLLNFLNQETIVVHYVSVFLNCLLYLYCRFIILDRFLQS